MHHSMKVLNCNVLCIMYKYLLAMCLLGECVVIFLNLFSLHFFNCHQYCKKEGSDTYLFLCVT